MASGRNGYWPLAEGFVLAGTGLVLLGDAGAPVRWCR